MVDHKTAAYPFDMTWFLKSRSGNRKEVSVRRRTGLGGNPGLMGVAAPGENHRFSRLPMIWPWAVRQ
jgi:hypothetical protein